jgi:carbonic anhydrase
MENMKKWFTCFVLLIASFVFFHKVNAESADWGYVGQEGPEHWATLSPEFSACAGRNQSPIDLVTVKMIEADLESIAFDYKAVPMEIVNNGHTVQVNYAPGSKIVVDGIRFELKQFHFHNPSENRIDGKAYAMEGHLVHADVDGNLAVVAVMFEDGAQNEVLSRIWKHMPKEAGKKVIVEGETVSAEALLPSNKEYYRFNGSLTTPPCTEGVRWLVLKNTASVSKKQVAEFHGVMHHDNNRPVQKVNARPVLK